MNDIEQKIYDLVRAELTDYLIQEPFGFCGHSYHASVALYFFIRKKRTDIGYKRL